MKGLSTFSTIVLAAACSPTWAADWSKWEHENAVAQERDWLVIRDDEEGCYLKQSYNNDPSKMELLIKKGGMVTLITPYFRGIDGPVSWQVDEQPLQAIQPSAIDSPAAISLPDDLLPSMLAGYELKVSSKPTGEAQRQQTFSLMGLTAAHGWLGRDECGAEPAETASGAEGETRLEVTLARGNGGRVHVMGDTDLPDGMSLMISLRRTDSGYFAQDKVKVRNGKFESAGFSDKGNPLPSGSYRVSVTSPLPRLQPASVRAGIGERGENLSGPAVIEENGHKRIDWKGTLSIQ